MRRLIGVSISPMVGSIYNMGDWDQGAAAWVSTTTRCTLREEAAACLRYNFRGMIFHPGLQEGHKKPPHGDATVQHAQKYPGFGYDQ